MADLMRRTFTVTLEATVSVCAIDDELVAATHRGFNNDALANDPDRPEWIARDRRLLAALLERPDLVSDLLRRHVASSLSGLYVRDDSLEGAGLTTEAEGQMLEGLQAVLPSDDQQFYHDVWKEGYFYDNTSYFQGAFSTRLTRVRIHEAEGAAGELARGDG